MLEEDIIDFKIPDKVKWEDIQYRFFYGDEEELKMSVILGKREL